MNQSIPLLPQGDSIPQLMDSEQVENPKTFWRRHLWWPLLAFAVLAMLHIGLQFVLGYF